MKKKLKDICTGYTKNIAQKGLDDFSGDYEIFGASGLIKKIDYYISEVPYIGIVKDGSGVGRVNSYPAKSSLIGTMQYIVPNNDVDLQFLMYGLRSLNLGNLYRGAAIPHIYFKEYKEFELNVPPKDEQQKIAAELDTIQSAIDNKKQQLSLLDEAVKSEFVEMFGDPVLNEKGWDTKLLDLCCEGIGDGLHGTPEYVEKSDYPFINGNNLEGNIIITSNTKFVSKETYEKHYIYLTENTLLLSINGTLGKLAYFNGETVMLGKSACYMNFKKGINRKFVFGLMSSDFFLNFMEHASTKSTIKNVGLKAIKEYKLILPPLTLQNQFAAFVQQIDTTKTIIKTQLKDLNELLESKMDFYFME